MAQITNVTSESLQAKIRQLLPSQQGFGEDLQAQNVIVPIIDLTETAEGSSVRQDLQTALALNNNTGFSIENGNVDIASTAGFYRVIGNSVVLTIGAGLSANRMRITDGTTSKDVYIHRVPAISTGYLSTVSFDFVVFLRSVDTLTAVSERTDCLIAGSIRQIANSTGTLVNPVGFEQQ